MIRPIAIPAALVAALALGLPAHAAPCAPREALVRHLAEIFEERRLGLGIAQGVRLVEIYASDAGSWSLVATDPRGVACLLASGQDWQRTDDPLPPSGTAG